MSIEPTPEMMAMAERLIDAEFLKVSRNPNDFESASAWRVAVVAAIIETTELAATLSATVYPKKPGVFAQMAVDRYARALRDGRHLKGSSHVD